MRASLRRARRRAWLAPVVLALCAGGEPPATAPPPPQSPLVAAHAALEARDFEAAAALYSAILREREVPAARLGYALSLTALGQHELALGTVLDGLARDPRQAPLLELLGDLRNDREQVEDALRSWREAFALDPDDRLREKILKAERELHAGRDYALSASAHFNVRFDGEVDGELAGDVVEYLEQQYWELARSLDHTPPEPITVVLYPRQEFQDVTQAPEWVGGLYDGKIRVPLGRLRRLDPVACALLRHELTHAVVESKTRGQCPRWLHEGLAQKFEGRPLSRADRARIAEQLEAADPADWESRGFSYPLALALTSHIEDLQGFDDLVRLLARLGQGEALDDVMHEVYGEGYPAACRRFARVFLEDHRDRSSVR